MKRDVLAFLGFLLLAALLLIFSVLRVYAAPDYATLTGTVLKADGSACAGCNVTFRVPYPQPIGGVTIAAGVALNFALDANGAVPSGKQIARTLIAEVTVDKAQVMTTIPDTSSVNLYTLINEPVSLPTGTSLNSLAGTLGLEKGGTNNTTWTASRCVQTSSDGSKLESASAACGSGSGSSAFSDITSGTNTTAAMVVGNGASLAASGTGTIDATDVVCTGCLSATELAADSVGSSEIAADAVGSSEIATDAVGTAEIVADAVTSSEIAADAVGTSEIATDGVGTAEIADSAVQASEIATGAVGTSEIADGVVAYADANSTATLAGDPAFGASSVWLATTGLIWEGATSNTSEGLLIAADVDADRTWTLPNQSGTFAVAATAPLAISATGTATCAVASGSQAGCLSSTDWTTFNNKQPAGTYSDITGTPANNQIAIWTDANTLEGSSELSYDTTTKTLALGDSASVSASLTAAVTGSDPGLDFTGGNIDCAGCRISFDSLVVPDLGVSVPNAGEVAFFSDANSINSESDLTYNSATNTLTTTNFAGNATTATTAGAGDSATAFFSSGTIEAARLPDADDDATTKGIITLPNAQFDCTAGSCSIATGGIGSTELADTFSATTITSNLVGNVTGNADTATLAATATTANAGDSATSFFSSGELERTLLPAASADCSANQFAKGVDADFVLDCAQPDHGGLAGLSDDDHSQYLLLAGRTLSDPGGGVTTIATQTTSSPLAMTNVSGFKWLNWDADLTVPNTSTIQVFSVNGSLDRTGTSGGDLYQFTGFHVQPTLSSATTGGPLFQDAFYDASRAEQTASTATQNTWVPISFLSKPELAATGTASLTVGSMYGVHMDPGFEEISGATLALTDYAAISVADPRETSASSGTPAITNYMGVRIEDLSDAMVTNPISVLSEGTTTEMRHAGPARFGATGAVTSGKVLDARGAATITGTLDLGDAVADPGAASTTSILEISDTIDLPNSTGNLVGIKVAPTSAQSESNNMIGIDFSPVITQSGAVEIPMVYGLNVDGTSTVTGSTTFSSNALLRHNRTYTTATVDADPASTVIAVSNSPTLSVSAASGTSGTTSLGGLFHAPVVSNSGGATYTVTADFGLRMAGTYTETSGTMIVTDRVGLDFDDVTNTSSATAITRNIGVDIAALSTATTNIGIRNADTTVYTPTTQAITANSDTIQPAATTVCLTANSNYDLTSNPQIANGVEGQILYLWNCDSAADTIEINDTNGLQLTALFNMDAGDVIVLQYMTIAGASDWYEVSRTED